MRLKYGLLCAFAPLLLAAAPAQTTDIILTGGSILTMAGDQPEFVEAILLRNGKIAALGTLATVKKAAAKKAELLDLIGRTVLPGFIDEHGHMGYVG